MRNLVKSHLVYFCFYLFFFVTSSIILTVHTKKSIHLYLNSFHSSFTDFFFQYATYLGDGLAILAISIILLFISKRMALQVALSGIFSGFIAQFLKKVVFGPTLRPSAYFQELGIDLYYVPGVDLHSSFSFPSGHSTAIFALITSLVLFQKSKKLELVLFLIALLVAYSRIYLSQHFLSDILFGSSIGLITACLIFLWLYSSKMLAKKKLDNALINFSTKRV